MSDVNIEKGFIETIDFSKWSLYGDTDSSYSQLKVPFDKLEDMHKTVEFCLAVAEDINKKYREVFRETVEKFGNVNPKYNFMFFKSEIIAARAMYNTKKNYGMAKIYDEGKFFENLALKKAGGQILKSDSTKIVLELLTEIYEKILLDLSIQDEDTLYREIFGKIYKKYLNRINNAVESKAFEDFGIPKKWASTQYKQLPPQVIGAKLYNYLFKDILRPGESIYQVQIVLNPSKLLQYFDANPSKSKYQIQKEDINHKLKTISFPVDMTSHDIERVFDKFKDLDIKFDLKSIIEFNLDKKIDQFQKIFSEETRRNNIELMALRNS